MNLGQIFSELNDNLSDPNFKSLILYGGRNQRYKFQSNQLSLILQSIERLFDINYKYLEIKGQEILTDEYLNAVMEGQRVEIDLLPKMVELENNLSAKKLSSETNKLQLEIDILNEQLAKVQLENSIILENHQFEISKKKKMLDLETKELNTQINLDISKSEFITRIISDYNENEFDPVLKTYLITILFGKGETTYGEYMMNKKVADFIEQDKEKELALKQSQIDLQSQKVEQEKILSDEMKFKSNLKKADLSQEEDK